MNRPQISAGTSTSVSLSPSTGEFLPEWLKRWDKKHGYNRKTKQFTIPQPKQTKPKKG